MATTIVTKNSSTASAVPTAAQLVQGELAVNVADKRLYTEDNAGAVVELGTNPSTLTVTGEITANGGIALGDNDKATFGASDDLQIYHDGTDSFISDQGTGNLKLLANDFRLTNAANNELMLKADQSSAVTAYYAGAAKLATTSTGIDVTGNMESDSVTIGVGVVVGTEKLRVNGTVLTLGGTAAIPAIGVGDTNTGVYAPTTGTLGWTVNGTQRLFLDSTGIDVTGDVSIGDGSASATRLLMGSGDDSKMFHNGTDTYWINDTGNIIIRNQSDDKDILIQTDDGSGGTTTYITVDGSETDVSLHYGGAEKLATTATGIDVTGTATMDGLTVTGTLGNFAVDTQGVIAAFSRPSTSYIRASDVSGALRFDTGGSIARLNIASNGDISFYEDTGTTAKFFWDASAESLGIGTSSPAKVLHVEGTATTFGSTRSVLQIADNTAMAAGVGGGLTFTGKATTGQGDSNTTFAAIHGLKENGTSTNTAGAMLFSTRTSGFDPAERMRIDSSGNVGIGRTPTVVESAYDSIQLGAGGMYLAGSSNLSAGQLGQNFYADASGNIKYLGNDEAERITFNNGIITFDNAPANTSGAGAALTFNERMRIDASGNLFVGKSNVTESIEGVELRADGWLKAIRSSNYAATLRRNDSDGGILEFNKDGTAVGSIGAAGGDITIDASGGAGVLKASGTAQLAWANNLFYPITDNAKNLGTAGLRFKDLYLSGGVYLGGTGAANKLEDYETGTWTPAVTGSTTAGSATYTIQQGVYTKIGNVVHWNARIGYTGHTGTGNMRIEGLPFTTANKYAAGSYSFRDGLTLTAGDQLIVSIPPNNTYIGLYGVASGTDIAAALALDTAVSDISINGVYTV